MIDSSFVRGFKHRKHRKHRGGRSRQTKSGAEANRNRSTTQYRRVNRSVKLGRPAKGIKIVLKLKAPATPAAIANAHAIEASRKSRGTLYLSRPNRRKVIVRVERPAHR